MKLPIASNEVFQAYIVFLYSPQAVEYNPIRSRHALQSGSVRFNDFNTSSTFKIIISLI